jgi:hypothetical protein
LLTLLGLLAGIPYLYYMGSLADLRASSLPVSGSQMMAGDLLLLALLLVISSLVGCFLSRRYHLAGLGEYKQLKRAAGFLVLGGLVLGTFSYLTFGRWFAAQVPGIFPQHVGWALLLLPKGALLEETVTRFGMMTILAGLARRPWLANLLQASFFTGVNLKLIFFFGIPVDAPLVALGLAGSFLAHLVFGAIYARYGLVAAMLVHLAADLKLVLHACLS